jgi:hypothetical protein
MLIYSTINDPKTYLSYCRNLNTQVIIKLFNEKYRDKFIELNIFHDTGFRIFENIQKKA